jgi:hypothetical protein
MIERKQQLRDGKPCGDEPQRASEPCGASTVVFYGDPQLVSDAFALALNAMDASAALLMAGDIIAKPKKSDS